MDTCHGDKGYSVAWITDDHIIHSQVSLVVFISFCSSVEGTQNISEMAVRFPSHNCIFFEHSYFRCSDRSSDRNSSFCRLSVSIWSHKKKSKKLFL